MWFAFLKFCAAIGTIGAAIYYLPRIWAALVQFSRFVVLFNKAAPGMLSMGVEFHSGDELRNWMKDIEERLKRIESHVSAKTPEQPAA